MSTDRTIPLVNATEAELKQFACVNLGLDIHHSAKRPSILAKVKAAGYDKEHIALTAVGGPAAAGVASPTAEEGKNEGQLAGEALLDRSVKRSDKEIARLQKLRDSELITVFIMIEDTTAGDQPVWACVNGRGQFIERGKNQVIRYPYLHALENAIKRLYDQDENNNMIPRNVLSYPVKVVSRRMPEQEAA
mgnify:CR=1 FL=1